MHVYQIPQSIMIQYYKKRRNEVAELEKLSFGCWINITPPFNYEELERVADKLNIPLDFLNDSLDINERARYEVEDDVKLIVITTPVINPSEDELSPLYIIVPIGVILHTNYIITISSYDNPILERFIDNKIKGFDTSDHSLFVLQLFEQNVLRYLTCLRDLNIRRNSIEQELYNSSRNKDLLKLLSIEKSLVYFVTALSTNSLLKTKIQRVDLLGIRNDENKMDLLDDIIIDINQAQEMAHIYSNILAGTMDTFASIISNNLNIVIQRLTLITIVLMVPTLVASFFGMNVYMPFGIGEIQNGIPFWSIIAGAALLSGLLVFMFRKQRML